MKWLSVIAVALAALLCVLPATASAQCANGQCSRIGEPVVAMPGQYFGGPVVFRPASQVYQQPAEVVRVSQCGTYDCNANQFNATSQPIVFACGSGSCHPRPVPDPISYRSSSGYSRSGSIGLSLNWGRCANGRCSTSWR